MKIRINYLIAIKLFFSVLLCIPIYSEWSSDRHHVAFATFDCKLHDRDFSGVKLRDDFFQDSRWSDLGSCRAATSANSFKTYTAQDFQHHFARYGYTQAEILNQHCLYMLDEFVKHVQTYPGYKNKIRNLYVELKNLNVIQKACCVAKGTYCRKLQKRVRSLYNSLDAIKKEALILGYCKVVALAEKTFDPVVSEPFTEYATLECVYKLHMPNLAQAINARSVVYRSGAESGFVFRPTNKSYNLDSNIKQLLFRSGHDINAFTQCYGNQLQQAIHQESLDILDRIDSLPNDSLLYDHQEALIDFAVTMVDYNHAGFIDKAMSIGDLCWTLLDYGQAIAEGAALGIYSAAHDIFTNPIEATVSIVAGKQVLAFQLCKVLYSVADIGVTAITNLDSAQEKWNKYAEPLNNIIDAINKKEITVRDAIKGGTALVVGYKAQGKLLGGLGKLCNTIKHKSINFVKNNSLLSPQEYLTTPEGLLFKATVKSNKIKLSGQISNASNLKNAVGSKSLSLN